ncbi:MAG TPA: hypothetical protein PLM00_04370 [Spirochaetota bacterium]|nr:hypothetical protein [Spirochaetota bacterium]
MSPSRVRFSSILFWGGVWGSAEASLGYLLHLMPGMISGAFMFPIGLFCMTKAARQGQAGDVFGVALVAAAIKSVNLFLPHLTPVSTLHPMIAILLQSAFGYAFIQGLRRNVSPFLLVPAAVIGWRVAFVGIQLLSASIRGIDGGSFVLTALPKMAVGSLIDMGVIALWMAFAARQEEKPLVVRLSVSTLVVCLAIISQGTIALAG